ncbi:MAG: lytic transglycosylase domain-containing protein [Nanoarchaeota archaeon]|nr:lytic transglycosylase domain-containing protein [Nanoarchaeota archaeon]
MKKKGNILVENVIFIILNLAFIGIIALFISLKTGDAGALEEVYAKQIALMIDSAKPDMIISLNMKEGIDKAKKELGEDKIEDIVKISGNIVSVSLRQGKSYSYSFFNNVDVSYYINKENNEEFVFVTKVIEQPGEDVLKMISYAKENTIVRRTCNCGGECEDYAKYISQYAKENGIESSLFLSLMMQESDCTKSAFSGSSVGLMQINLIHCGEYGLPTDPEECKTELLNNVQLNIETGAKILVEQYNAHKAGKLFVGCTKQKTYYNWEAALRGYNGWGCGVDASGNAFVAQDNYVEEVVERYNILRGIK